VDVAGESVLLLRTRDGDLRAHYNVCRHRGSQVVPAAPAPPGAAPPAARKVGSLRCPYHSWTYRLDGALLRAPWIEDVDGFDPAAFGLHPVGAATWGGFVFLHLTPAEAVPLAAQLGPVPERLRRYPLTSLRVGRRLAYRVKGELVYPDLMLSLSADHVAAFTLWPHGPDATTVVCELLFHPDEVARPGFDPSDAADFWDLVNRQDWAMCESVQRGMGSRAYGGGWFAPMEDASLDIRRYLLERPGESVGP
jgi:phenylpropionate dioxygenase-like ring-hydroxylating dioxygenase large terminal subunit